MPDVLAPQADGLLIEPAGHDAEGLLALFQQVFGHGMSPMQWRWKYSGPPGTRSIHRVAVAPGSEGRRIPWGHVGALVLDGVWRGRTVQMAHLTDVMVHPAVRGGMQPGSVYARLMRAMARDLMALDPHILAFGFPGRLPSRLGSRMGLYRPLGLVTEHTAQAIGPGPGGWACGLSHVDWDHHATSGWLDECWGRWGPQQVQPRVARNARYMMWRYRDHPARPYRLWRVRAWGWRDRGWVVTRDEPRPTVVDALLPSEFQRPEGWGRTLAALAKASGHGQWLTWRAPAGPHLQVSSNAGLIEPGEFRASELAGGGALPWAAESVGGLAAAAGVFQPGDTDVY